MAIYFKGQEVGVVTKLEDDFDAGFWTNLPDGLKSFSDLETIKLTEDVFLIHSADDKSGVWRYKKSTNNFLEVIDTSYIPSWYQVVGDSCFIASKTDQTPKVYKASTDELRNLPPFNTQPTSIYFSVVNDKCVVITWDKNFNSPIYIYDSDNVTFTLSYADGIRWRNMTVVGDKCLITGIYNYATGILVYNSSNNSINLIDNGISGLQVVSSYQNNLVLMSTSVSAAPGLYIISLDELTSSNFYTEGVNWKEAYAWGNWVLLSLSSTSNQGLFLYNFGSPTTAPTVVYQTGYNYKLVKELEKSNGIVLTSPNTTVYFDKYIYEAWLVASRGNLNCVYEGDGFLLLTTGMSTNGIYYFNVGTLQINTLSTQGAYLTIIRPVGIKGNVFINSSPTSTISTANKPMFLYKASENNVTQIAVKFIMDTFEDDGYNCRIKSSNKDCPYIFYYNDESESVTLSQYRIDE